MKLIENWRQGWRMLSIRLSLLGSVVPPVWVGMPPEYRDAVLDLFGVKGIAAAVTLFFLIIIAARVKSQNLPPPSPPQS